MIAQRQPSTQLPPLPKPQTITTTPPPLPSQKTKPLYREPEAPKEQYNLKNIAFFFSF